MTRRRHGPKQDEAQPIDRRWLESDDGEAQRGPDARIARMLSEIPQPPPLSPSRLAAVAARLPGRPLPTHLPRRQSIRLAVVLSFLLGSASAVFARKQIAHLWDQVTSATVYGPSHAPLAPPANTAHRRRASTSPQRPPALGRFLGNANAVSSARRFAAGRPVYQEAAGRFLGNAPPSPAASEEAHREDRNTECSPSPAAGGRG